LNNTERKMLDTNICIYIIKNRPKSVRERFETFKVGQLCLSSITVSELIYGAYKSSDPKKNLQALEMFLMPFEIMEYGYDAAQQYGRLRASLEKRGRVIGGLDMQIAAHALSLDMAIVTNNEKEFVRVDGLRVENWVK